MSTLKSLPARIPITITLTTEIIVNKIPSVPALSDSCRFIPKPNPITAICSKYFEAFLLKTGKGEPSVNVKMSPKNKATGGVAQGVRQKNTRSR